MRGPEGKIQDKVLAYAKKKGLLYKKNEVGRMLVSSGWPDVTFFPANGHAFFMEFKAPGAKPTPLQAHRHQEIRNAGYEVCVVDDVSYGKEILDRESE